MTLKQITVFLENSPGRLREVTAALGEAGINLKALCLTGASGYGVLRLIVSDHRKARNIVMEHLWPARVDDVVVVRIPDVPGSLASLLAPLRQNEIDVEYMYAFTGFSAEDSVMIFGFNDPEAAAAVLEGCDAVLLGPDEFGALESSGE